jgi:8-oxo-dGTP pyrophosphatase MutT (NUDIX family)
MSCPSHVAAAGVFLLSSAGRILMVQTFNRLGAGLILPGGLVEAGESPSAAGAREAAEEVGLLITIGRLLAVEHRASAHGHPPNLQFVFVAKHPLDESVPLTLQPEEIAEACWVDRDQVVPRHTPAGRPRMRAALAALDSGIPAYLET